MHNVLDNDPNPLFAKPMLADRLFKFRVFYELENQILCWSMNVNQEKNRVSTPTIFTHGKILGTVQSTNLFSLDGSEIFVGDIVNFIYCPKSLKINVTGLVTYDASGNYCVKDKNNTPYGYHIENVANSQIIGNYFISPELLDI